jgi:hypothetical protein
VTGTGGSITETITPRCGTGDGPWTAILTLTVDINAQDRTYPLRVKESPPIGSSAGADIVDLPLTVLAAETTTTIAPGPTTTTVPGSTPTTEPPTVEPPPTEPPAENTTTTQAPTTSTTTTSTTQAPATSSTTSTPTTVRAPDETTTTTTDVSPTSTSTVPEGETLVAAAPPPPPPPPTRPSITTVADADSDNIAVALPATVANAAGDRSETLSFGSIAEAIPRSLRDLVVSPFVIIRVILRAIQDTGAVSIWAMLLALPVIIDWRRMWRRLRPRRAVTST